MKNFVRLALSALFLASAVPAFAGDCEHCANCPKKTAAEKATAAAEKPADKKPEAEKPKCECAKGKDCACAKDKCKCAHGAPKAA